jgi:hypothetical protein
MISPVMIKEFIKLNDDKPIIVNFDKIEIDMNKMKVGIRYDIIYYGSKYGYTKLLNGNMSWEELE